ncbi:MAG: c-type cytochrome [Spirochaetes bacterium]|nr:c-type cytochrome [Spirochaetota bacterium]
MQKITVSAFLIIFSHALFSADTTALSPCGIAVDGTKGYVILRDTKKILVLSLPACAMEKSIAVPATPTGIALGKKYLFVTGADPAGTLMVVDPASGTIVKNIPAGNGATYPAVGPGGMVAVCNRFDGTVSLITSDGTAKVVRVSREPVSSVFSPAGDTLFVANLLPTTRADAQYTASVISVVDIATGAVASEIRLPNGSTAIEHIALSPDGNTAYAVHTIARFMVPTTQIERGWMYTAALSVIDVQKRAHAATIVLDDAYRGAANPSRVAVTPDGSSILVVHQGTHEMSVIDRAALHKKIAASTNAASLADDLTFLAGGGLRKRIPLNGQGFRSLAVSGGNAYVPGFFSDSISVVDLASGEYDVTTVMLASNRTMSIERKGEMLFNDASICFQQWQSCASCHPDARVDGFNWDLLNDGLGNPKNVRSLLNAHKRSPVMSHGIRASAEAAVRAGIRFILFTVRPESDAEAIDAYMRSLTPAPSPYLKNGALSTAAQKGKTLFTGKAGCIACHTGPMATDLKLHDVGTKSPRDTDNEFVTPTLVEVWRTAPYMHDGRYTSIKEVITVGNAEGKRGSTASLPEADIDALVEYILSL